MTKLHGWALVLAAILIVHTGTHGHAQVPLDLFRGAARPTTPGPNGTAAYFVDVDTGVLSQGPSQLWLAIPGAPDMVVEQDGFERRGSGGAVWRGKVQSEPDSSVVLTLHRGLLAGLVQRGEDTYAIQPARGGQTILEKLDPASFPPEWGHDGVGPDKVPPAGDTGGAPQGDSTPPATSGDSANQILLMSVYTPQARSSAGGTAQMETRIQAAVDQANTGFINSNMIARFVLVHTAEVAYNDTGNMESDLYWVTGDSGVASLRNTHHADMVSLIVKNGGGYCGIAWVQRNPGSDFANYAFQVSDLDCLTNHTFAHEHGHNMGFEHNPENSSATSSSASYPWSFAHYVNGSFRTIMSYSNPCTSGCSRALAFSNPDITVNGFPAGIPDQRDNSRTGDSTAPIVANFRLGEGNGTNSPPAFTNDPISKPDAGEGQAYAESLSGDASDPDGDPLTFSKTAGPAWLSVAANGDVSGTPGPGDGSLNSFTVSVSDGNGGSDTATLEINVISLPATPAAPSNLRAKAQTSGRGKNKTYAGSVRVTWSDNSNNEDNFVVERCDDVTLTGKGKKKKVSCTPGSWFELLSTGENVTSFSDNTALANTTYLYRVMAINFDGDSDYSNEASVSTPSQ